MSPYPQDQPAKLFAAASPFAASQRRTRVGIQSSDLTDGGGTSFGQSRLYN
jgi:hypothetical protein